ncbi:hypothetical protein [Halorhabdus amylolytica]|uniref:hypothetical protein n=1 Tax=Halorhabdus amylolytica TaxID=2559573 RepID=UPI0010AB2644|nr:hypothetical protein [Halorhabdus amylolytica]
MSLDAPTEFFDSSDHPLAEMYRNRVEQNRDLVILITDSSNDRGTGKTTEALRLAHGMDRTEEGLTTEKVALNPHPLIESYTQQPRGSGLVLDESEVGLDKYKAGSGVNRAIRELVSTGRVEEKYLILNAPADHLVDKDLKTLVDVWILVERRGFANVYRMDWNPHQSHELTHKMGTVEWDPIPKDSDVYDVYQYLTEKKEARLRGDDGDDYVKRSKVKDMVDSAKKEATQETRNELIQKMKAKGLSNPEVGDIVDLSPSRVSQIVNSGD